MHLRNYLAQCKQSFYPQGSKVKEGLHLILNAASALRVKKYRPLEKDNEISIIYQAMVEQPEVLPLVEEVPIKLTRAHNTSP